MNNRKPLPPEKITLCCYTDYSVVIEKSGREEGASLHATAPGLEIYILIEDKDRHPDCIVSMMINACISRHIPASSLRYNQPNHRSRPLKTETKEMF